MAQILSGPNVSPERNDDTYFTTCRNCGTVFLYRTSEIEYDFRENDSWVHCPTCKTCIDHDGFNNWNRLNDKQKYAVKNRQPIPNDY